MAWGCLLLYYQQNKMPMWSGLQHSTKFVSQLYLVFRYMSWNWNRTTTTRCKIVKMDFYYNFNNLPVVRFSYFLGPPYFDHRYIPFRRKDSGLSVYYRGNADFVNVWEWCWLTQRPLYNNWGKCSEGPLIDSVWSLVFGCSVNVGAAGSLVPGW